MSKTFDVGIRITADGRVLVSETNAAKAALAGLADSARKAGAESAGLSQQQERQAASSRNVAAAADEQSNAIDRVGSALTKSAGAYLSYQAAMAGGRAIIDTALANERLNNTLVVATGSAEAAARETAFLRQESEKLGLQFVTTSSQYAKLAAAAKGTQLEGQATRDIFLAVAKAATVLGMSAADTGGALLAIQQMISKGKVNAEELRGQLGERLPGAFQMAARAIGVTTAELDKMLEQGQVTAERLLPGLAVELEATFGAQSQAAAQGLNAKINRLENSFSDLKTAIGNTGLLDLLSSGIVLATRFVDALSGAKVLSAVDAQKQKIAEMRTELERMNGMNGVAPFNNFVFSKKDVDALEQRIDDGIQDLKRLGQAAQETAEAMSGKKVVTPGAKPELPKEWKDAAEKVAKERERAAAAAEREMQRMVDSSTRVIAALKLETEQIGLNAIQKKMLVAATEAAKAPTEELAQEIMASAQAWALATQRQEELMAAEKQRMEAIKAIEKSEQEAARAAGEAARKASQEWNQMWGNVEQTARNAFVQFAAHGKSAMESIGQSIKIAIIDMLYQLTVRKWIINIGASLEGSFAGALTGGSPAGGGMLNSLFNGANLLNAGKTIFNGFSSGIVNGGSSLIGGLGRMVGSSTISAFASGMGGTGAAAAQGAQALWGASGLTGANALGASAGSFVGAAAGPLMAAFAATQLFRSFAGDKRMGGGFGKAMNAVGDIPILGDFIPVVPLMNSLFGHGPMKFRQQVAIGTASEDGFDGRVTDVYRAKGGLLVRNKHHEQSAQNESELVKLFDTTIGAFADSARQFADNLGISKDSITGYSREIRLESEKGKTLTQEAIQGMLASIGDDFARGLVPQINELAKSGESAFATLTRLNAEFTALVDAGTLLGSSVANARAFVSGSSFEGRTAFVDAAGGIDALMTKAQFFADNFLNEQERLAPKQERLNTELTKLGLSTDLTKDQFRSLVQSFGSVNGISEQTLQSLLNLQGAFIEVRNTQEQLATASQEAAKAERERVRALQMTALNTAFTGLQKSVDEERKQLAGKYNNALDAVNTRIQNVTDSVSRLKSLSDALKSTVNSIAPLTRDQAKQQIRNAIETASKGGALPDADSLRSALGVLGDSKSISGSSPFEMAREQAKTAILLGKLGGMADSRLTVEEKSLDVLIDQRKALESGFKQQMQRLDDLLEQGQRAIDAMNGISPAITDLTAAIGVLNNKILQLGGAQSDLVKDPATGGTPVSGNPKITDQQIRDFVRTPGRSEMDIYNAAKANGVSFAQYAAATGAKLEDLYAWADKKGLKRFASGGYHRGGLRIVGENGPELEFTGPSRIASNNDFSRLLRNDDVLAELRTLVVEIRQVKKHSETTAARLNAVTRGGTTLRTKAA